MKTTEQGERPAGIGDAAVKSKTGKWWQEWFAVLDEAGAESMSHAERASFLSEKQGVPPWWSQMVAVGYEQAQGIREKHQAPSGYQIGASKTIGAPVGAVYQAWTDDNTRDRWLPGEAIRVRKATPNKSLRVTWSDGQTSLDVNFYDKGGAKSQVVVQHTKLSDSSQAQQMKSYWKDALERLKVLGLC